MSAPKPPSSLDNSCTVVYNNTLYSYSPNGFVSIALEDGAKWKKLDMGVKVSGATCVGSARPKNTDPAFFVIGGLTDSDVYTGLQKYTYSTGKWTTIKPTNLVTKHRQWHTSAYIEASDTMLVFGGNQNGNAGPSADTFSISASEPYTVTTPPSRPPPDVPPPSSRPILTKWTDSDLVMVGGGTGPENAKFFYFNPEAGWRYSGSSLAEPLSKDANSIHGICISGSDGSSSMIMFDLSQSPNKVSRVVLRDANGRPNAKSAVISRNAHTDTLGFGKRGLALSNWPEYNATLAPKDPRPNAAMAQAPNGMIVFSGGNAEDPIALFDTSKNSWVNATTFFTESEQKVLTAKSTASSTSATSTLSSSTSASASTSVTATSSSAASTSTFVSATSTSSAASTSSTSAAVTSTTSATAAMPPSSKTGDPGLSSNIILGITLGSIAGFLVLLGIILFFLRRRNKKSVQNSETGKTNPSNEKDMSALNGNTYSPTGHFRGHRSEPSTESYSSAAILMGRVNKEKSSPTRKLSSDSQHSSVSSLRKQLKTTISKPIPQIMQSGALQANNERGVAFAPSVAEPRPRTGRMEANDGTRRSSGWNRYWSGGSALQVLGLGSGKRVTATSEHSSYYSQAGNDLSATHDPISVPPLSFDGRPRVNSVNSGSPTVAQHIVEIPFTQSMSGTIEQPISPVSSGYSSGVPESVNETWNPKEADEPWGANRAPSSVYAPAAYKFPGSPGVSTNRQLPSGDETKSHFAMESTSDMSWLNLDDQSRV